MSVDRGRLARTLAAVLAVLALATIGVLILEQRVGLRDGSAFYLLAVALIAVRFGSWPAVATAVGCTISPPSG